MLPRLLALLAQHTMTGKQSCLLPRTSSMSLLRSAHVKSPRPPAHVDARFACPLPSRISGEYTEATSTATHPNSSHQTQLGNELGSVGEFLQFSQLHISSTQDGSVMNDNGVKLAACREIMESSSCLLPPSEPSPLAVHIGLYSVLNEPEISTRKSPFMNSDASREFSLLEGSKINQAAANEHLKSIPPPGFLDACFICKRRLGQGLDTYMYRGEIAFCSIECRQHQILMEEQQKDCSRSSTRSCISSQSGHERSVLTNSAAVA